MLQKIRENKLEKFLENPQNFEIAFFCNRISHKENVSQTF